MPRVSPKAAGVVRAALHQLVRFPGRAVLPALCALLGVAGVTAATAYAQEGRIKVVAQLQALGTHLLTVTPRRTPRTRGVITTLLPQDYVRLRREIPQITASSAELSGVFPVKAADLTKSNCTVLGVEPAFQPIESWPLREGRFFGDRELRTAARVAVLGDRVAHDLFGDRPAGGEHLAINRVPFEVIGVLSERGQGLDADNPDNQVYIPLTTARRRLMNVDYYSALLLSVSRWEEMDEVASQVHATLLKRHQPLGREPEDFWVRSQKSLLAAALGTADRLGGYVTVVGWAGVLFLSLGMLTIRWLGIAHRRVEIGTCRALGASAVEIFAQMWLETVLVIVPASVSGLVLGRAVTALLVRLLQLPFFFDLGQGAVLSVLALVLSLAFATLPALRAACLDPIHALR